MRSAEALAPRPSVATLPVLEQVLLWCMRAWVVGHVHHQPVACPIESALGTCGAAEAAPELETFMWAVGRGARRVIAVDCPCVPVISEDELLLLRVIALAQHEHHEAALDALCEVLDEDEAERAVEGGRRLALTLAAAGLSLTRHLVGDVPRHLIH